MNIYLNYRNEQLEKALKTISDVTVHYNNGEEKQNLKDVDVLITSRVTEDELETANQLKAIFIPFTGVNHLPFKMIKEKDIQVVNSHAHAPIVALRAVTLGLSLLGRVVELHNRLKEGVWTGHNGNSSWTSILNMKIGMIGMGDIGLNIVNYLKPYQTTIVTLERYKKKCHAISPIEYYDTIAEVCENADLIFVSLPLTKETENIIDKTILKNMNEKYIVNVGRGALINEEDLYNALKNNTLKGAAIDVWYQYPRGKKEAYPSKFPIHTLDNVVLSPHCAGHTIGTKSLVVDEMVENIKHYLKTNTFLKQVDLTKEY